MNMSNLRCADGPPTPRTGPCNPAETFDKLAGMPLPTARPIPKQKQVDVSVNHILIFTQISFTSNQFVRTEVKPTRS